jgi:hypothetical protein
MPRTMHEATQERWAEDAAFDARHPAPVDHMRDAYDLAQKADVGLLCREGKPIFYLFVDGKPVEGAIKTLNELRAAAAL